MKLDTRQKIFIPLIIIAFIYIGWQIYEMFYASPTKTISAPETMIKPVAPEPVKLPEVGANQTPQKGKIQELAPGSATGQSVAYQHLMKTYQELEAERMLLQEEMAIAETKQKIAQLQTKLNQMPGVKTTAISPQPKKPVYKLIFIDHQDGQRWSAALSDNNNVFREVVVGSTLSDGSKVTAIDNSGVTIKKDEQLTRLTFFGAQPIAIMPGPVITAQPKTTVKTTHVTVPKPQPKPTKVVHKKLVKKPPAKAKPKTIKVAHKQPVKQPKSKSVTKTPVKKAPIKTTKHTTAPVPKYTVRPVQTALKPNYKIRPVAAPAKPVAPSYKVKAVPKKATPQKPITKKKPDIDINQPIIFSPLPPKPGAVAEDY